MIKQLFNILLILGFSQSIIAQGFLSLEKVNSHESLTYKEAQKVNPDSVISLSLEEMKTIPNDISKFKNIHQIEFYFCLEMDINKELNKLHLLKNLISISIYAGDRTTEFPSEILKFSRLKEFLISGWKFKKLPESFGSLKNLEVLAFGSPLNGGCNLEALPKSIVELKKLKSLNLWGNMEIKLGDEFYNLHQLTSLEMTWVSYDAQKLFANFENLTSLDIIGIEAESLEGISNLKHLKKLDLGYHENLKTLGSDFNKFNSLEYLSIRITPDIYNETEMTKLSELKNLKYIYLEITKECPTNFPFPKTGFNKINTMHVNVENKVRMEKVIDKISRITSLTNLTLVKFQTPKLPSNLFELSQLKTLQLISIPLKKLNGNFKKLNIDTLKIYNIPIETLPKDFLKMRHLKYVTLGRTKIKRSDDFLMDLRKYGVRVKVR